MRKIFHYCNLIGDCYLLDIYSLIDNNGIGYVVLNFFQQEVFVDYLVFSLVILLLLACIFFLSSKNKKLKEESALSKTLAVNEWFIPRLLGVKNRLSGLLENKETSSEKKSRCNILLERIKKFYELNVCTREIKELDRFLDEVESEERKLRYIK